MQLGLGSYACAWAIGVPGSPPPEPMDSIGLIQRASSLGLRLIQIADNLPLEKCSDGELKRIRDAARDHAIGIEVGTRGISGGHLPRMLEICELFASPILRVVVDTREHHPSPDEVIAAVRDFLPALRRANVSLAIENHDRFTTATLASIIERIGSPDVGICLDTVNSFGSLEGPQVVVERLAPFVINLHIKDFAIERAGHMMGFTVTGAPAGEGRLDVPWLLDKLRSAGRDPNAILELWPAPEAEISATIRKEEEWCQASVRYLRTYIP